MKRITNREKRQALVRDALPKVRNLVGDFGLEAVNKAIKMIAKEFKYKLA